MQIWIDRKIKSIINKKEKVNKIIIQPLSKMFNDPIKCGIGFLSILCDCKALYYLNWFLEA